MCKPTWAQANQAVGACVPLVYLQSSSYNPQESEGSIFLGIIVAPKKPCKFKHSHTS